MVCFGIALLAVGWALDGTARSEVRAGSSVAGENPNSATLSTDLRARTAGPDGDFAIGVAPSGTLARGSQIYTRAFAEAGTGRGPVSARVRQRLGYGTLDFSPVSGQQQLSGPVEPSAAVQPPPAARFVQVNESNTTLELSAQPLRRLAIGASAGWVVSGGANARSRDLLPLSRGSLAHASLLWATTRLDTLGLEMGWSGLSYSNGRQIRIASLTASWHTRPTRDSDASVALGSALTSGYAEGQRDGPLRFQTTGSADLRMTLPRNWSASMGVGVAPMGDPLSGDLVERGSFRTSAGWGMVRGGSVSIGAIGSMSLTSGSGRAFSPRAGDRFLEANLTVALPIADRQTLSAGLRAGTLSRPLPGQARGQWIVFLGYDVRVSLLR